MTENIYDRYSSTELGIRKLLYSFVICKEPRTILELGTHTGGTTIVLASALQEIGGGTLWGVDIVEEHVTATLEMLDALALSRVSHKICRHNVFEAIEDMAPNSLDLVFVDDDHDAAHVAAELQLLRPRMASGGWIIMHDVGGRRCNSMLGQLCQSVGGTPLYCQDHGLGVIQTPL